MGAPSAGSVVEAYRDGVTSIAKFAAAMNDQDWHRTACGDWSAGELARHLAAVTDWYHQWLDRSLIDDFEPPFSVDELADQNELEVHERRALTGPEAISFFVDAADGYLDRVMADPELWDRPFGYPFGTATVGLHLGAAANEWHVHASDLAGAVGLTHEPADVATTVSALVWCQAQSTGRGGVARARLSDLRPQRNRWARFLAITGRT